MPLKSKKRVHIRVHKRTNKVHKRIRKSTAEMHSIIAIKPNPACWRLATSHERFIAWGIELPKLNKVCIMGKPRMYLRRLISHFIEKDEESAGEKRKSLNIAFSRTISLLKDWQSQTTDWLLGKLGYPLR